MSKPSTTRASVRDCEEKEIVVDDSVVSLGFGFLHLPPTRYAPLVIKTVKQDSWADQQGIIPGSELIELDGTEAGRLSAEEFRQVLKQRPLRLKVAPPHGEVWKQVAAFQQQVVALSLQKVHLQQALKDESDRVMRELGICTELEKSNSMQHKAKLLKDQAQRLQEKQALEEETEKLKAELQVCHSQLMAERQQMDAERAQWQAELEGSHAKLASECAEREKSQVAIREMQVMMDSEKAQLESERQMRQRVEEEKGQLQASLGDLEAQLRACKAELEVAREGNMAGQTEISEMQRSRADLEQERQLLEASQAELQAEKTRCAAERIELEALRQSLQMEEKDQHLEEAASELSKLRGALINAQPDLQALLAQLATPEIFKAETSMPAPAAVSAAPASRHSYARRSVVPVAVPAPVEKDPSDEEMF